MYSLCRSIQFSKIRVTLLNSRYICVLSCRSLAFSDKHFPVQLKDRGEQFVKNETCNHVQYLFLDSGCTANHKENAKFQFSSATATKKHNAAVLPYEKLSQSLIRKVQNETSYIHNTRGIECTHEKDNGFLSLNGNQLDKLFNINGQSAIFSQKESNVQMDVKCHHMLGSESPQQANGNIDNCTANHNGVNNDNGSVLMFSHGGSHASSQKAKEKIEQKSYVPSLAQLKDVEEVVIRNILEFRKMHNYSKYHKDVVIENNWVQNAHVKHGVAALAIERMKLKMRLYFFYTNIKVFVLKSTCHEEEGTIKIRWRVSCLPQLKSLRIKLFYNKAESRDQNSVWFDGISTLTVNKEGQVIRITLDRAMEDEMKDTLTTKSAQERIVEKLKQIKEKIPNPVMPAPT